MKQLIFGEKVDSNIEQIKISVNVIYSQETPSGKCPILALLEENCL